MNQAFYPADILLPVKGTDMSRWAVVACDQFTSEPEYWEDVDQIVGDAPSTVRLTLPEVYLGSDHEEMRLAGIREAMQAYEAEELLTEYQDAMIYIERTDSTGKVRAGIVGAVDLNQYDYRKGSTSMIRATEGTIVERIPPRLHVRKNAPIELPHIMILIDDVEKTVIEKAGEQTERMELLYDFELMKGGGRLQGWLMPREIQKLVLKALDQLALEEKNTEAPLLFAVGDGNHSLATAKEYYEKLKAASPGQDLSHHPARYALCELVNLHSPALEFEAIHRILTNVNSDHLMHQMTKELGLIKGFGKTPERKLQTPAERPAVQAITVVIKGQEEKMLITKPTSKLSVGSLQHFLDQYMEEHQKEGIKLDYIHGKDNLKALTWQTDSIGFILPDMGKEDLFPTVKADGALPRKTFSMGHAEDKRYYMECRRIR